jgi:hypothetical protein
MYWGSKTIPLRLKPGNVLEMLVGTAEAMPFQSSSFQGFHVHAITLAATVRQMRILPANAGFHRNFVQYGRSKVAPRLFLSRLYEPTP